MKDLVRELVTQNPMLIEVQRFRRRFMMVGSRGNVGPITMGLVAACYLGCLAMVINWLGDIPPIGLLFVQLSVITLIQPTMLYGTIAGERENRTWDLLLAAPMTKAQLVIGKYLTGIAAMAATTAAFAIPIILTAATYAVVTESIYTTVTGEVMVLSWGCALTALTVLVSARSKRPFTALGFMLSGLVIGLIIMPVLIETMLLNGDLHAKGWFYFHPFIALADLADQNDRQQGSTLLFTGWGQTVVYLAATAGLLTWAVRTLTKADNERPRATKHDHA